MWLIDTISVEFTTTSISYLGWAVSVICKILWKSFDLQFSLILLPWTDCLHFCILTQQFKPNIFTTIFLCSASYSDIPVKPIKHQPSKWSRFYCNDQIANWIMTYSELKSVKDLDSQRCDNCLYMIIFQNLTWRQCFYFIQIMLLVMWGLMGFLQWGG